jgi:hypothetical protein
MLSRDRALHVARLARLELTESEQHNETEKEVTTLSAA